MPSLEFHRRRRAAFLDALDGPVLLTAGGFLARNYPANPFPYRADSNFLYFFPRVEPGAAAFFDPAERTVTLFLNERTPDDALWHGAMPGFEEEKALADVDAVLPVAALEEHVVRLANGRKVRSLAVADPKATARVRAITGEALDFESADGPGDPAVYEAIFRLRAQKEPEELEEMAHTARVTTEAHVAAMAHTRVGGDEQTIAGIVDGTFWKHGCQPAYSSILSVRGEVLHNHDHGNPLRDGDLLLLDAGAEAASGYCSDVTRTWPVNGEFTPEQAEVYDIVLRAELAAIDAVKPGVRYRDVHMTSARVIADGLVQMGLMKGKPDTLVEAGAHAVFFPHGVGHLIGIDVHDMEGFGDRVHYPGDRTRSTQFGTAFLRMDRDVEPGYVFTIEPGIYFVPAILHETELRQKFGSMVDYAAAERFLAMNGGRGFGGIRIEDDVLCTADGPQVLTPEIPKTRADVERTVGSA